MSDRIPNKIKVLNFIRKTYLQIDNILSNHYNCQQFPKGFSRTDKI